LDLDIADCLARVRGQDQDAARSLAQYLYPKVIRIVGANLSRRAAEEELAEDFCENVSETGSISRRYAFRTLGLAQWRQ
jgi:hypothetical protein